MRAGESALAAGSVSCRELGFPRAISGRNSICCKSSAALLRAACSVCSRNAIDVTRVAAIPPARAFDPIRRGHHSACFLNDSAAFPSRSLSAHDGSSFRCVPAADFVRKRNAQQRHRRDRIRESGDLFARSRIAGRVRLRYRAPGSALLSGWQCWPRATRSSSSPQSRSPSSWGVDGEIGASGFPRAP